jgi:hypothetical protein
VLLSPDLQVRTTIAAGVVAYEAPVVAASRSAALYPDYS